jgi:hypothetical protein
MSRGRRGRRRRGWGVAQRAGPKPPKASKLARARLALCPFTPRGPVDRRALRLARFYFCQLCTRFPVPRLFTRTVLAFFCLLQRLTFARFSLNALPPGGRPHNAHQEARPPRHAFSSFSVHLPRWRTHVHRAQAVFRSDDYRELGRLTQSRVRLWEE